MARHKANHIQVVYAPSAELADKALAAKAAMFATSLNGCTPTSSGATHLQSREASHDE
jgi:hypothetical protein